MVFTSIINRNYTGIPHNALPRRREGLRRHEENLLFFPSCLCPFVSLWFLPRYERVGVSLPSIINHGYTEKTFNTEAQSARRKKKRGLERNFSVNYYDFLRVLRVSVVKYPFFSGANHQSTIGIDPPRRILAEFPILPWRAIRQFSLHRCLQRLPMAFVQAHAVGQGQFGIALQWCRLGGRRCVGEAVIGR